MDKSRFISILLAIFLTWGCESKPNKPFDPNVVDSLAEAEEDYPDEDITPDEADDCFKIPYVETSGGLKIIPVRVNGMPLDMIYDTGATETMLSLTEAQYLYSKGLLTEDDFIETQSMQMADGSITEGLRIRIKRLEVGTGENSFYIENITATVSGTHNSMLLLGQNVMQYFRSISIDTEEEIIKFYEK